LLEKTIKIIKWINRTIRNPTKVTRLKWGERIDRVE